MATIFQKHLCEANLSAVMVLLYVKQFHRLSHGLGYTVSKWQHNLMSKKYFSVLLYIQKKGK